MVNVIDIEVQMEHLVDSQLIVKKNCGVSPNRLHDAGQVRKDERNHEEQHNGEPQRRSCSKG